ncbi:HET-domain-containing protein [Penicillium odoratum]|uniref:HET-domain-containing protein n=1 Tax=Penicillium odoratum TaxID=1167516 RepID=UPI0025491319|nr:HET-domain-containing protein [Penicillium odoratum]KAJ5760245.1 HET-domain-containing protein [Penicillium odoratum]
MGVTFRPLNAKEQEIRLLTILPDKRFSSDLRCSLHTMSLKKPVRFEALSYVWGGTEATENVLLEGRHFRVTPSLAIALRYLRKRCHERVVWADSICIDQRNAEERNSQILLMTLVYTASTRVISFLGEATHEIERMVSWTERYIYKKVNKRTLYWWKLDGKAILSAKARHEKKLSLIEAYHGTVELSSRPYWTRLWTYQEYNLPESEPICLCGHVEFKACTISEKVREHLATKAIAVTNQFSHSQRCDDQTKKHLKSMATHLIHRGNVFCFTMHIDGRKGHDQKQARQLSQLLWRTPRHQCSDPKDRIYALYGMSPAARDVYPPDYNKPVEQVMKEATKYIIEHEIGLMALHMFLVRDNNTSTDMLPTWVPDFTKDPAKKGKDGSQYIFVGDEAILKSEVEYQPYVSPDLSTLHLWARHAGNCKVLFRFHATVPGTALQIIRFLDEVSKTVNSTGYQERFLHAFLLHDPECLKLAQEEVLTAIREIAGHWDRVRRGWQIELVSSVINGLEGTCGKTVFLAISSFGRCLGVSGLRVYDGDLVVLANTASQPMVLREKAGRYHDGEQVYHQLVGPAFLDGVADTRISNPFYDNLKCSLIKNF